MSFLVASNDSSRSWRLDGRWYIDSSSSSSARDSPFVNGGVVDCDSSSSVFSGPKSFLAEVRPVSSEDVALDSPSNFSIAGVGGILPAPVLGAVALAWLGAGDFVDACTLGALSGIEEAGR